MFDKTLDAAIGRKDELSASFEELNAEVEKSKKLIVEEALGQIGAAGANERKKIEEVVNRQIQLIQEKVENTRVSAEDIAAESVLNANPLSELQQKILSILKEENDWVSLTEVAKRIPITLEASSRALSRLQRRGSIDQALSKGGVVYRFRSS